METDAESQSSSEMNTSAGSMGSLDWSFSSLAYEAECADAEVEKEVYTTVQPHMFEPLAPVASATAEGLVQEQSADSPDQADVPQPQVRDPTQHTDW